MSFPVPSPPATFYTCPGERHSIPRSVHLARLHHGFPACRNCEHRCDGGLKATLRPTTERESPPSSHTGWQFTENGIRGRYLNDLTRTEGQAWGSALARHLWEQRPLKARSLASQSLTQEIDPRPKPASLSPLTVVVGYDDRPSSPDLAIGVVTGLRLSGCHAIDIGVVTAAQWSHVVAQRGAAAGILVTGSGCHPSWTGFDFLGSCAQPLADDHVLAALALSARHPAGRMSRSTGVVEVYPSFEAYWPSLQYAFHALRPLTVAACTASPLIERALTRLFESLHCHLILDVSSGWSSSTSLLTHEAQQRFCTQFSPNLYDVGVWIAEDGQTCQFFDADGTFIHPEHLWPWLLKSIVDDRFADSEPCVVVANDWAVDPQTWRRELVSEGTSIVNSINPDNESTAPSSSKPVWLSLAGSHSPRAFFQAMQQQKAAAGIDRQGRCWIGTDLPRCDALLTLAAVMRGMSWSDAPLAERLS